MGDFFEEYMPHGYCYLWMPEVLWLNVLSDAAIVIAYFSIPISLIFFISRRPNFPFGRITQLFSLFILSCGFTHAMSIWTVWNGDYGIHGLFKFVTALASVATAIALVTVIPRALAYRSPDEYEMTLAELRAEIVERERAESAQDRLQQSLSHVTRVGTMNEMSTSLAHELNQPLSAITLYCQAALRLARKNGTTDEKIVSHLQEVHDQAQRAGDVIRELRQFIQKGEAEKSATDVNKIVEESTRLIEAQARDSQVELCLSLTEESSLVVLNHVQITQVLVNLLRNSIEAMEGANSPERAIRVFTVASDDGVKVVVEDTGPGIAMDGQQFKPFESTKSDGMGMGLSISQTIVESHGGVLEVDPSYTDGARFEFTLSRTGKARGLNGS